ncbi:type II toxin-antitoxin system VapC family toxin [Coxiella burnetii]|uniref:PIN domain protein n=2 Tax=Coxiella burnetii TaxID=777 RepID=Q83C91_COXBU|nr:type II toxin-antitoxin system VapC family toxin [Coxiella burnetii]NP_820232.2 PIN domain-containing protein [Coxiella burnetii RSA 493]AAO90746.2 PIN domain protein [Coxiella burnetii RSA 493]ABS77259.2 PIN domain protein [Coxiella burnetii Dugway 5J108-111]ACJ18169.1 PIN domain protein [Coxiella burnetii CbuG_Q212]AML48896.1 twitching motility protein PilT [Coxiella burnetii]AML54854.1 twitching motility protein PilT [Coxiella burnetii]
MTMLLLLDTDIIIDFLRGQESAVKFIEKTAAKVVCHISTLTIAELYVGARDGEEYGVLERFLQIFTAIEVSPQIAQLGGLFRRDYGKSHGTGLADAIIAATTQCISAKLVTLNKKHYPMLKNIHVPYLKS